MSKDKQDRKRYVGVYTRRGKKEDTLDTVTATTDSEARERLEQKLAFMPIVRHAWVLGGRIIRVIRR